MIIQSCHIAQFGKWKEKNFDFSEGLNPFLWENGEGKTTLMHFFHTLFYGLSGERKQDVSENERKHYKAEASAGISIFRKMERIIFWRGALGLERRRTAFASWRKTGRIAMILRKI